MAGGDLSFELRQLSRLYGVQTRYCDYRDRWSQVSEEHLLALLDAMSAPVDTLSDVPAALREAHQERWRTIADPVLVAWEGRLGWIRVRLPARLADVSVDIRLDFEDGDRRFWGCALADVPVERRVEVEGEQYVTKRLRFDLRLPLGYHRLVVELPGYEVASLVVAAPRQAHVPPEGVDSHAWGVFIPLYALRSKADRGSGTYADFGSLTDWVGGLGGQVVATLPILPTFVQEPHEPSPYLPISRLFWNELYVDVPHARECSGPAPENPVHSGEELERLAARPLVDYRHEMESKRFVLESLAGQPRGRDMAAYLRERPMVEDYAVFRAICERQESGWQDWPQNLRDGLVDQSDYDPSTRDYYIYAQWLAHRQVEDLAVKARAKGPGLYLDLPLGVHPGGYDTWRNQDLFAAGATAGAPPDAAFTSGQDWTFPPMHPARLRDTGYGYFIDVLRHHFKRAGILRIDHVMALHRLFWIPAGGEAKDGTYVRYASDEMYAILALESQRCRSIVVGEDLGTVPPDVRPAMRDRGLHRTYVVQYELMADSRGPLAPITEDCVASMDTHDMFPFASFVSGADIEAREKLGVLRSDMARAERSTRHTSIERLARTLGVDYGEDGRDPRALFRAVLQHLSASPARIVLVNLENLWSETEPQNIPGTSNEHPNWRRKARFTFEEFKGMSEVKDTLLEVNRLRKGRAARSGSQLRARGES